MHSLHRSCPQSKIGTQLQVINCYNCGMRGAIKANDQPGQISLQEVRDTRHRVVASMRLPFLYRPPASAQPVSGSGNGEPPSHSPIRGIGTFNPLHVENIIQRSMTVLDPYQGRFGSEVPDSECSYRKCGRAIAQLKVNVIINLS
jgi:hypothetical protein